MFAGGHVQDPVRTSRAVVFSVVFCWMFNCSHLLALFRSLLSPGLVHQPPVAPLLGGQEGTPNLDLLPPWLPWKAEQSEEECLLKVAAGPNKATPKNQASSAASAGPSQHSWQDASLRAAQPKAKSAGRRPQAPDSEIMPGTNMTFKEVECPNATSSHSAAPRISWICDDADSGKRGLDSPSRLGREVGSPLPFLGQGCIMPQCWSEQVLWWTTLVAIGTVMESHQRHRLL